MPFGIAVRDLYGQTAGFARVFLRLIKQVLNRARDPVRKLGIRFEAGQFRVGRGAPVCGVRKFGHLG